MAQFLGERGLFGRVDAKVPASEVKSGTLTDSWQYCYDLAGNLTSQGTDQSCPRGTTYTYDRG